MMSVYLRGRQCLLNKTLVQDITSNLKVLSAYKTNKRHYASKSEEKNKLERIYYGPLTPQIRAVKIFSLTSSVAGIVAQPIIFNETSKIGSTTLLVALSSVVGFFTFVTPLLLHFITKKYVTEMHYDPETSTYTATYINFFTVPVTFDFKAEDVVVPDIPGMFTTLIAKGKPIFLEARYFSDPLYYAKIMGYDKPLDFKLGNIEESESNNK